MYICVFAKQYLHLYGHINNAYPTFEWKQCIPNFRVENKTTTIYQARAQGLKRGGGETEKLRMRFATLSNIVVHTISQ